MKTFDELSQLSITDLNTILNEANEKHQKLLFEEKGELELLTQYSTYFIRQITYLPALPNAKVTYEPSIKCMTIHFDDVQSIKLTLIDENNTNGDNFTCVEINTNHHKTEYSSDKTILLFHETLADICKSLRVNPDRIFGYMRRNYSTFKQRRAEISKIVEYINTVKNISDKTPVNTNIAETITSDNMDINDRIEKIISSKIAADEAFNFVYTNGGQHRCFKIVQTNHRHYIIKLGYCEMGGNVQIFDKTATISKIELRKSIKYELEAAEIIEPILKAKYFVVWSDFYAFKYVFKKSDVINIEIHSNDVKLINNNCEIVTITPLENFYHVITNNKKHIRK